jgi:hypothetical protein
MSILLHLNAEMERRLRAGAAARGETLEAYLEHLMGQSVEGATPQQSAEEWSASWRSWAASHRALPQLADDSRDSIYEGRGE